MQLTAELIGSENVIRNHSLMRNQSKKIFIYISKLLYYRMENVCIFPARFLSLLFFTFFLGILRAKRARNWREVLIEIWCRDNENIHFIALWRKNWKQQK